MKVSCKKCSIVMHGGSVKAIETISDSMCKEEICPCKSKVEPIFSLAPPDFSNMTRKERKAAKRAAEFEKRMAHILKGTKDKVSSTALVPAVLKHKAKPESMLYFEFDAPISEHMML